MIVACFLCLCVLLSLMDLSQPAPGWAWDPWKCHVGRGLGLAYISSLLRSTNWGAAKQLAHFVTMVSHRQTVFEKAF